LDRSYFKRVYTRSTQVGVVAALICMGLDQRVVALGLLAGLGLGLFSTFTVEATVRLLFRGGSFAGLKLLMAAMFKLPIMLPAIMLVAWACFNKLIDPFATIGGVLLVHATMLVMVIGTAMSEQDTNRERYR